MEDMTTPVIKSLALTVFFTWVGSLYASDANLKQMLLYDHENPGCPINSTCQLQLGQQYLKWKQLIDRLRSRGITAYREIEAFRKRHGLPIGLWSDLDDKNQMQAATWDSPCKNHQTGKIPHVQLAEAFIKNTLGQKLSFYGESNKKWTQKRTNLDHQNFLDLVMVQEGATMSEYWLPRGETPSFMPTKKSLAVLREIDGLYYYLQISQAGSWQVIPDRIPAVDRHDISCPQALQTQFKKKLAEKKIFKNLYSSIFCKKITHHKSQRQYTYVMGWSCL